MDGEIQLRGRDLSLPCKRQPEVVQILLFRGRRSRNKVSVGEPAEGSLTWQHKQVIRTIKHEMYIWIVILYECDVSCVQTVIELSCLLGQMLNKDQVIEGCKK